MFVVYILVNVTMVSTIDFGPYCQCQTKTLSSGLEHSGD